MKNFVSILTLGTCLLAFSSFKAPVVSPQKVMGNVENETLPFDRVINVCGEGIAIEGVFHAVINETESANGNIKGKVHINAKGKGVGLESGAKYQWNDAINDSFNLSKGEVYTGIQRWRIIGQGSAPDFFLNATVHLTVNANGEVTVDIVDFSEECK